MKLTAIALACDGTIADNDKVDSEVRSADLFDEEQGTAGPSAAAHLLSPVLV